MQAIPQIGDTISSRYQVEEILDKKQETIIYRCTDTRLDVPSVVKYLIPVGSPSLSEQLTERFLESARTQARLNHPNIVRITNIESRQGVTFAVMEHLNGATLQKHITQLNSTFTFKEILEIFIAIVDAISMAHEQGVYHQYLNPSNVILNLQANRLTPRILNFSAKKVTRYLNPYSALPYVSPEQMLQNGPLTEATDIYSVGALLYFLLIKVPPFIADNHDKYVEYHKKGRGVTQMPPEIPQAMASVIEKCMHPDPSQRYGEIAEILAEIKGLVPKYALSPNLSIEVKAIDPGVRGTTNPSQAILRATGTSHPALSSHGSNPSKSVVQHQSNPSQVSYPQRRATGHSNPVLPQGPATHTSNPVLPAQPKSRATGTSNPVLPQRPVTNASNPTVHAQSSSQPAATPLHPELLRQYRLEHILHQTAESTLALVRDKEGQKVCLKYLGRVSEAQKKAFLKGIHVQRAMAEKSPYVQRVHSYHEEALAFSTPNEARQSLREYCRVHGPMDSHFVVHSFLLLAQVLQQAHESGYIHGNLKPENLFFIQRDAYIMPVLYDFSQRLYPTRKSSLPLASMEFIAPELLFNVGASNVQSDIFSFGMLMNFSLLGKSLYGDTLLEISAKLDAGGEIPSLQNHGLSAHPSLIQVVDWCTAKDPAGRYQSFSQVLRDLHAVTHALQS